MAETTVHLDSQGNRRMDGYDVCHTGTWNPLKERYGLGPTDDATHGVLEPRMIVVERAASARCWWCAWGVACANY